MVRKRRIKVVAPQLQVLKDRKQRNELNLRGLGLTSEQLVQLLVHSNDIHIINTPVSSMSLNKGLSFRGSLGTSAKKSYHSLRHSQFADIDDESSDEDDIIPDYSIITHLDLSNNKLTVLPVDLCLIFPKLDTINLIGNNSLLQHWNDQALPVLRKCTSLKTVKMDNLTIEQQHALQQMISENSGEISASTPIGPPSSLSILSQEIYESRRRENELKTQSSTPADNLNHTTQIDEEIPKSVEESEVIVDLEFIPIKKDELVDDLFLFYQELRILLKSKCKIQKPLTQREMKGHKEDQLIVAKETLDEIVSGEGGRFLESFEGFYNELVEQVKTELDENELQPDQINMVMQQAKFRLYHYFLVQVHKVHLSQLRLQEEWKRQESEKLPNTPNQVISDYYNEGISVEMLLNEEKDNFKLFQKAFIRANNENDSVNKRYDSFSDITISPLFDIDSVTETYNDHEIFDSLIHNGSTQVVTQDRKLSLSERIFALLCTIFPILSWFPRYYIREGLWSNIRGDLTAGISIAFAIVPQSIAYSSVVGTPPIYGLYSAFTPLLFYVFFGTSRVLSVGPSAVVSLLAASAIHTLNPQNLVEYLSYASLIGIFAGALQILFGVFRLGFLVNFLSKPVLSGFTSSSAILIAVGQLPQLLGLNMASHGSSQMHWLIYDIGRSVFAPTKHNGDDGIHLPSLAFGLVCIVMIFVLNYIKIPYRGKNYSLGEIIPVILIVIVFSILAMFLLAKARDIKPDDVLPNVEGIKILGSLPSGLPKPQLPLFIISTNKTNPTNNTLAYRYLYQSDDSTQYGFLTGNKLLQVFLLALPVVLVAFTETISVAKHYAAKDNYQVDPNQELIALGICTMTGGFFQAFPTGASMSRSALSAQAGARSQFASLLTGLLMIFVLLFMTPLFYYLPKPLLAAIIITAVVKLIDFQIVKYTWTTKKKDCLLWVICFVLTMFVGIEVGILSAVLLSLGFMIFRTTRPRCAILGRLPGGTEYRSLKSWPNAIIVPGVLIMRFDAELYFANVSYFVEKGKQLIQEAKYQLVGGVSNETRVFILDMSSVNQIDWTAIDTLKEMQTYLKSSNVKWYIANAKEEIYTVLKTGGFVSDSVVPEHYFYRLLHNAVLQAMIDVKIANMQKQISTNTMPTGGTGTINIVEDSPVFAVDEKTRLLSSRAPVTV